MPLLLHMTCLHQHTQSSKKSNKPNKAVGKTVLKRHFHQILPEAEVKLPLSLFS